MSESLSTPQEAAADAPESGARAESDEAAVVPAQSANGGPSGSAEASAGAEPSAAAAEPSAAAAEPSAAAAEPSAAAAEPSAAGAGGDEPAADPSPASDGPEPETAGAEAAAAEGASPEKPATAKKKRKKKRAAAPKAPPVPDTPEIAALRKAKNERREIEGRVIGWNNGGFHVVVDKVTAFCPRSEMEPGGIQEPQTYLDQTFRFLVLRIQKKAKRVVISRVAALRAERGRRRSELREKIAPGAVLDGRIASLTDFGAFVDLGGVQGLVHVSEIRRERTEKPAEALAVGQQVRVKVLKVEQGGKRISLSMKALEPDPWKGVKERFEEGAVVDGVVEKVASFGAFVALEPGLTGLLPTASMTLPRGSSAARLFPPGKKVSVQILRVDPRRRRISLTLEGSKVEGSRADYESYVKGQKRAGDGFNALAAALEKIRPPRG